MWRSLPHEHQCMIFADCRPQTADRRLQTAVCKSGTGTRGRGHRNACVETWDLGKRHQVWDAGTWGRGHRDEEDAGCERLSQKSEVNAISLSS